MTCSNGHVLTCMVPYAPLWSRMVLYGSLWSSLVPYRPVRSCMVPYGTVWSHVVLYVPVLLCIITYGPVWSCMVSYDLLWACTVFEILSFSIVLLSPVRYKILADIESFAFLLLVFIQNPSNANILCIQICKTWTLCHKGYWIQVNDLNASQTKIFKICQGQLTSSVTEFKHYL